MQIIALNRRWTIYIRWLVALLIIVGLLVGLAIWQLERAASKTRLLKHLSVLQQQGAVSIGDWQTLAPDLADGMRVNSHGRWLAPQVWLVDNQMVNGRIGYDVVVPVQLNGGKQAALVNLGWVAAPMDRVQLPVIDIPGEIQIQGIIRSHWGGLSLGQQNIEDKSLWPMRIQKVDIEKLNAYFNTPLYPAIIYQLQNSPYQIHYQPIIMSPERHRAYALQWALLALAVVIIAVAASAKPVHAESSVKTGAIQ